MICDERLGLSAGAVEREHELAVQPLSQRMHGDERLELAHELRMPPERKVGLDPLLEGRNAPFLEACDLVLCERVMGEVGERGSAPERERLEQRPCRQLRIPCAKSASAVFDEPFKSFGVELLRLRPQQIAGASRDQDVLRLAPGAPASKRLAQLGDVDLDDLDGRGRRVTVLEVVDQAVNGNDLVSVEQQDSQERPLLDATQGNLAPLPRDRESSPRAWCNSSA